MPNQCSAPGFRINYRGEPYTPVFKLPNTPPELREQWLKSQAYSRMSHHFKPEDIITVDKIMQADRKFNEKLHERPKLRTTAVPMLFLDVRPIIQPNKLGDLLDLHASRKKIKNLHELLS